ELLNLCVRCHGLAQVEDGDLRGPALANCREALARRQVLVEKGTLPADYPIPAHLRDYAAACGTPSATARRYFDGFVPATALRVEATAAPNLRAQTETITKGIDL